MKLYTYANSSAAYRVRIAMNLKSIHPEQAFVHLLKDGGEHHKPDYKAMNLPDLVPTLGVGRRTIGQSLALTEYLDETHPTPRLLPPHPLDRARVRQIAL